MAKRLVIVSNVGGALGLVVGLCIFVVQVVWKRGRDDVGLVGDAIIAYLIGAGIGGLVFAVQEFRRKDVPDFTSPRQ